MSGENPVSEGIEITLRIAALLKELLAAPLCFSKDVTMALLNHTLKNNEAKYEHRLRINRNDISYIKPSVITQKQLERLQKNGEKFEFLTVPTDKLEALSDATVKMGGALFCGETNGEISVVAVPQRYMSIFNNAMKTEAFLSEKKGKALKYTISKEDIDGIDTLLRCCDIPVTTFADGDNYIHVVDKDNKELYEAVKDGFEKMKPELQQIEVTKFDKAENFKKINFDMRKVTLAEANRISEKSDIDGLKFYKTSDENEVILSVPADKKADVDKLMVKTDVKDKSADYMIEIGSTEITLDMKTLGHAEGVELNQDVLDGERNYYIMRVPGTWKKDTYAGDFLKIPVKDCELINDGKTIRMNIKPDSEYMIYNVSLENGAFRLSESGNRYSSVELSNRFDFKIYGEDKLKPEKTIDLCDKNNVKEAFERVDFFDKDTCTLIRLPVSNAKTMYDKLLKNGINEKTADNLITKLNERLDRDEQFSKYKETLNIEEYVAEKNSVKFTFEDVANDGRIEKLYQQVVVKDSLEGMERVGSIDIDDENACCVVLDKEHNRYSVVSVGDSVADVKKQLEYMEITDTKAALVTEQIVGRYESYVKLDNTKTTQSKIKQQNFEGCENVPIANQFVYNIEENKKEIAIARMDDSGNTYVGVISPEMNRWAVEDMIVNDFGIKSPTAAAEVSKNLMKSMDRQNMIEAAPALPIGKECTVRELTSKTYSIEYGNGKITAPIVVDKDKLTVQHLTQGLHMNEKEAAAILKRIKISENFSAKFGDSYAKRLIVAKKMSEISKGTEKSKDFVRNIENAFKEAKAITTFGGR